MTGPEAHGGIGEADPVAPDRARALQEILLAQESVLPVLAQHLGGASVFESAIRGSSMSPAIPALARLRVRLISKQCCKPGDVVFYLADTGFMVHRVVRIPKRGAAAHHVLTRGDNCLAPDPPVRRDRVLGTVVEIFDRGQWRAPGPARTRNIYFRLAQFLALSCMLVVMYCTLHGSSRLALSLQEIESAIRPLLARVLRRLRLVSSAR